MSRIPLPEPETLPAYFKAMHDGADPENDAARSASRAFAVHPEFFERYMAFYYPFHTNDGVGLVEPRIKELVRLRIATLNGCKLCKAARLDPIHVSEDEAAAGVDNVATATSFTAREKAAIAYAEKMATAHHDITDEDVSAMRRLFSDAEFLELAMMTGQYIGFGRVLATLQLEVVACPID